MLTFLREYVAQAERTKAFCKKLADLNLLEPMQAQFTLGSGEKSSLRGFMAVDRNKLKSLGGEALAALVKTDELELLYLHLHSMRNFEVLKDRLVRRPAAVLPVGEGSESPAGGREGRPTGSRQLNTEPAMAG